MKLFKEDSIKKVEKEIEALKHLRGGPNIIEFIDAVQGDSVRNLSVRYCRQTVITNTPSRT
jgi:hypothetical protein